MTISKILRSLKPYTIALDLMLTKDESTLNVVKKSLSVSKSKKARTIFIQTLTEALTAKINVMTTMNANGSTITKISTTDDQERS